MKALEKAAKDREGTEASAGAKDGISLEPMPSKQKPAIREPAAAVPPPAPARPIADLPDPAQAASMIDAGRSKRGGGGILQQRPLFVFSIVAGLCAAGYGGYVYLQLTNPALFAKQAPRPTQTAQVKPPAPPVAPAPGSTAGVQTPPPLSSLGQPDPETPPAGTPAKESGTATPAIPVPSLATAVAAATTVATRTATAADLERKGTQGVPGSAAAPAAAQAATTPPQVNAPLLPLAPVPAPTPESARDTIKVTSGSTTPVVNPLLTEAYTALTGGNLDTSQRLYNQALRSDPGSIDALLGLAAIATQQGNTDEATRRYLKVLELDPRNALAQAGLIGILGRADPQSSETRVKQLIAREPAAAYLHFALGITYVDQKRWPDAQQAFFQAYQLQPDNPDYAFNLAVALEHIGQPRAALDFYRRAVQAATVKGRANFSTVAAEERIGKLEKVVK